MNNIRILIYSLLAIFLLNANLANANDKIVTKKVVCKKIQAKEVNTFSAHGEASFSEDGAVSANLFISVRDAGFDKSDVEIGTVELTGKYSIYSAGEIYRDETSVLTVTSEVAAGAIVLNNMSKLRINGVQRSAYCSTEAQ